MFGKTSSSHMFISNDALDLRSSALFLQIPAANACFFKKVVIQLIDYYALQSQPGAQHVLGRQRHAASATTLNLLCAWLYQEGIPRLFHLNTPRRVR